MTDVRVVFITAPAGEAGKTLAKDLVDHRLAACVNVVPGIRSIYRWEGKTEDDEEVLLIAKTTAEKVEDLTIRVKEVHPYSVPEIIVVPVVAGSDAYLRWVRKESGTG